MKALSRIAPAWLVHIGAWIPLLSIACDYTHDGLTANPIQAVTLRTGKTALVLLVLTLAVTPAVTLTGQRWLVKLRRLLGLYAFMYVAIHFLIFTGLDYGFDAALLGDALFEKRYAYVGLAAGLILLSLAITSTKGWMRRLGKNWKRLHRGVYLAGALAVVHYAWLVKSDYRQPLAFGALVLALLALRLPFVRRKLSGIRLSLGRRQAQGASGEEPGLEAPTEVERVQGLG